MLTQYEGNRIKTKVSINLRYEAAVLMSLWDSKN